MIVRRLEEVISSKLFTGKVIVLTGPRQTGKTTLIHNVLRNLRDVLILSGDDSDTNALLSSAQIDWIEAMVGTNRIVFIDEAQRIEKIGRMVRMMADHSREVQWIISGSSSQEIKNAMANSLTGRKWEYLMYPVTWSEFEETFGYFKTRQQVERRVIYGMYPDIITHVAEERERLKQLINSYLHNKSEVTIKLLKALALQIGKKLSLENLSKSLHTDTNTLIACLDLLEKNFITFAWEKRIFFWDNGIRNAILNNFNPLSKRKDADDLWENFITADEMKKHSWIRPNLQ